MITDPEVYFAQGCGRCARFATPDCSTRRWLPGLAALRRICREAGLQEAAKWGHPCYLHAGRNVAILGAFRGDYRLSFFHAALLQDPEGLLERQGPRTKHPDCLRFDTAEGPLAREAAIRALLAQAMDLAARGVVPPKETQPPDLPEELVAALAADPALAEGFRALTPGRQKSWALQVGAAKGAATRRARIDRGRARILSGKGPTEG